MRRKQNRFGMIKKIGEADPKWMLFMEIFSVQNAFGVPDTGTMLYYAVVSQVSADLPTACGQLDSCHCHVLYAPHR